MSKTGMELGAQKREPPEFCPPSRREILGHGERDALGVPVGKTFLASVIDESEGRRVEAGLREGARGETEAERRSQRPALGSSCVCASEGGRKFSRDTGKWTGCE